MRFHLAIAAAALICITSASAQQQPLNQPAPAAEQNQTIPLICPLDGFNFNWPIPRPSGSVASHDSDFCSYHAGLSVLAHDVITCPKCNYTDRLARFSNTLLDEETRGKLFAALVTSPYRGVNDSMEAIPTWERCRLGQLCAATRGLKPSETTDFVQLAIYTIRVRSTRRISPENVGPNPLQQSRPYKLLQRRMTDQTDPVRRIGMKIELAMIAHRMGLPAEREQWLADASDDPALTPAQKTAIENFQRLTRMETDFQRELLKILEQAALQEDIPPDVVAFYTYLQADTHRRLGEPEQAAEIFARLRANPAVTASMRAYVGYFLDLLREHLPEQTGDVNPD